MFKSPDNIQDHNEEITVDWNQDIESMDGIPCYLVDISSNNNKYCYEISEKETPNTFFVDDCGKIGNVQIIRNCLEPATALLHVWLAYNGECWTLWDTQSAAVDSVNHMKHWSVVEVQQLYVIDKITLALHNVYY